MSPHETCVYDELTGHGFRVLTKGWPDFFVVYATGRGVAIECKGSGSRPTAHQAEMHEALRQVGVDVRVCEEGADSESEVLAWLYELARCEPVARNEPLLRNVAPASAYASASAICSLPGVTVVEGEDNLL